MTRTAYDPGANAPQRPQLRGRLLSTTSCGRNICDRNHLTFYAGRPYPRLMADRTHPEPPSGPTHGIAPKVLSQGSGGTLSSQLYSDYDRTNLQDLDDLCGRCDE